MEASTENDHPVIETTDLPTIPAEFFCPLSGQVYLDPVRLPEGIVVERDYIERWINLRHESPFNRTPLELAQLINDNEKKTLIENFLAGFLNHPSFAELAAKRYHVNSLPDMAPEEEEQFFYALIHRHMTDDNTTQVRISALLSTPTRSLIGTLSFFSQTSQELLSQRVREEISVMKNQLRQQLS